MEEGIWSATGFDLLPKVYFGGGNRSAILLDAVDASFGFFARLSRSSSSSDSVLLGRSTSIMTFDEEEDCAECCLFGGGKSDPKPELFDFSLSSGFGVGCRCGDSVSEDSESELP